MLQEQPKKWKKAKKNKKQKIKKKKKKKPALNFPRQETFHLLLEDEEGS